jgi:hypothetical protein
VRVSQQFVELSGPIQCCEIIIAAYVALADEDLRHSAPPAALGDHHIALAWVFVHFDFADLNAFALK